MKYAFIGKERGLISFALKLIDNKVILILKDDGPGLADSSEEGFGMLLIRTMLSQLNAECEKECSIYNKDGLIIEARFQY